jgi:hypothetical protein
MRIEVADNIREHHFDEHCASITWELYDIVDGDTCLAQFGVMAASAMATTIYLWFTRTGEAIGLGHLREGRKLIEQTFAHRTETILAEASIYEPEAQAFLRFLGFKELVTQDFVVLYEWST